MNTGHMRTLITVTKVTDAQSEPGQIWTYRYKNCNELLFHLIVFSCHISYGSQCRHCFCASKSYDKKLAEQVILHLNAALDMFTMVYLTLQ